MGVRVQNKKTLFQVNNDGKLQEVRVMPIPEDHYSDGGKKPDSDPGKEPKEPTKAGPKSNKSGVSDATTVVAFSNYQYPLDERHPDEGAVFMRMRGKPGIYKRNLVLIPLMMFMFAFTAVDVMQSSS